MHKVFMKRSTVSTALTLFICMVMFATTSLTTKAEDSSYYKEQFDFYVDSAASTGLIPALDGSLDDFMSESDLIDFIFQFSKVKCGTDVDSFLNRARALSSSEERAKVSALNEMLSEAVWKISTDGELNTKVKIPSILGAFQYAAYKQIADFSPLLYHLDNPVPFTDRYNFWGIPTVVYHEEVLIGLLSEIIGLSKGTQRTPFSDNDYLTRRQFAAFCYMFSTMSLPKDKSGKYPGGVSGNKTTDDFTANILDNIIKPDMTDNQKIKAVYDYIIYNFKHNDNATPILIGSDSASANPLSDAITLASPIVFNGNGTCDVFANVFRLLTIRLGYECNYVSGQYVNKDGSSSGHGWNQIKVNDEWYWMDVDVEGQVFHRGNASEPSYFLFMKKDSDWNSNHSWNKSGWPAADGTKYPMTLSRFGESIPGTPNPATMSPTTMPEQLPAIPTASTVLVNGKKVSFDAYNINGNNYFKLRDIAFVLYGTEAQFEVEWNQAANAISLTRHEPYTSVGGEMTPGAFGEQTAILTASKIHVDGEQINLIAYNINSNNYFKLRDIANLFDFSVAFDGSTDTIVIDTGIGYKE